MKTNLARVFCEHDGVRFRDRYTNQVFTVGELKRIALGPIAEPMETEEFLERFEKVVTGFADGTTPNASESSGA